MRGNVYYASRLNNGFQALNADGTKAAHRAVARECYGFGPMGRESPLYGTRPIVVVHDEIVAEAPLDRLHAAAFRMSDVMRDVMRSYLPDVHVHIEPAAMAYWCKNAEMVLKDGVLQLWEPEIKVAA